MTRKDKKNISKTHGRKLFLIDAENVCGHSHLSETDACAVRAYIEDKCGCSPYDLVLIGASHKNNYLSICMAWGSAANAVYQPGHNGADIALLKGAKFHLKNASSFDEVVVASGDAIFENVVRDFVAAGSKVTVMSRLSALSRKLSHIGATIQIINQTVFD